MIIDGVRRVGSGLWMILALAGLRFMIRTQAWRLCMRPEARLPFGSALQAFLAGDAIGSVTPLGLVASEPMKLLLASCAALIATIAHPQAPEEKPLEADEIRSKIAGKAFGILSTDGSTMLRVQYDANGVVYLNLSGGRSSSGKWTAKPGMICTRGGADPESCRDVRRHGEGLELKRVDGKWTPMVPQ